MIAPSRLEGETDKAYAALCKWLELGPGRTLGAAAELLSRKPQGYRRTLEQWSSRFDWAARAAEHDRANASAQLERAAESAADSLAPVRERLAELATQAAGVLAELLRDASQRGSSTRLQAARAVLELAGVVPPRRPEPQAPRTEIKVDAVNVLSRLGVEELERLVSELRG